MINKIKTKGCSACLRVKPISEFSSGRGRPPAKCKECSKDNRPVAVDSFDDPWPANKSGQRSTEELRAQIKQLLAHKGFRQPEWVAKKLGISVEHAANLMFQGKDVS